MLRCIDCGSAERFLVARSTEDYCVVDNEGSYLEETPEGHPKQHDGVSELEEDAYCQCLACGSEDVDYD